MSSISFSNCEVNDFREKVSKCMEEMLATLAFVVFGGDCSIDVLEITLLEEVRTLYQRLFEISVLCQSGEQVSERVVCPECEQVCCP